MPHLDDDTLRVMKVLEAHPALDALGIASRAELSVTATEMSLKALQKLNLLTGQQVFSLNGARLSSMLAAA
jgi:hypothetical protein